jgi:hypothetical protein
MARGSTFFIGFFISLCTDKRTIVYKSLQFRTVEDGQAIGESG